MTATAEASLSVRDFVRSQPADEETYELAEKVITTTVGAYPGADPSTGTDEHGNKLYPKGFLLLASVMSVVAIESIDNEDQATADAYKVNA